MATKKFDMLVVKVGYNQYAMPAEAARAIFDKLAGEDIYKLEERWDSATSANRKYARLIAMDEMPTLQCIGPVQFHTAVQNAEMEDEEKAKKNA